MCGCPPSFARSQKAEHGIPDIFLFIRILIEHLCLPDSRFAVFFLVDVLVYYASGGFMKSNKIKTIVIVFLVVCLISGIVSELYKTFHANDNHSEETTEIEKSSEYYTYGEVEDLVKFLGNTSERERDLIRLVDPLNKSQKITVQYLYDICKVTSIDSGFFCKPFSSKGKDEKVTRDEFDEFYYTVVSSKKINGVNKKSIFVYEIIKGEHDTLFDGEKYYQTEYTINDKYKDTVIEVYVRGDVIYKILGLNEGTHTLKNVLIEEIIGNQCYFLYKDIEKCMPFDANNNEEVIKGFVEKHSKTDAITGIKPFVADIDITNDGIVNIYPCNNIVNEKVIEIDNDKVRISNLGTLELADDFELYDIYSKPYCEDNKNVMLGHKSMELFIDKDNYLVAGIINDDIACDNVRVIISNKVRGTYDFTEVRLSCDEDYVVTMPDGNKVNYKTNDLFELSAKEYALEDEIIIEPSNEKGKISIFSIMRDCGVPQYSGKLHIYITEAGMRLINEIPMEKYLYSVVSGMMPPDSLEEANNALAVCARGYAYSILLSGAYSDLGADLDDTSACQMYANVETNNQAVNAVKNTYGLVPVYKNNLIVPFYYSTSCGTLSASNQEDEEGEVYPFYQNAYETEKKEVVDISDEENFKGFINSESIDMIEKDMPYYRWKVSFSKKEMSDMINFYLENNFENIIETCAVVDNEGNYLSDDVYDIGDVLEITVCKRTVSGAVCSVIIKGSEKIVQINNINVIRTMISPENHEIIKNDGTTSIDWSNLPSPFFYVELENDKFVVNGGGLGSGAGLSINGACCLANNGYNYKYILRYYFPYIDVVSISDIELDDEENEE